MPPYEKDRQSDKNCQSEITHISIRDVYGTDISRCASEPRATKSVAPPDGGWGWMVVIASFVAHLIADGCSLSFGVLFTELLEAFEESKSKTAWVGSLFISMPLICGPFASMIVNRYGCRAATMTGGVLAAVGCILSAFVNSIDMLCLTFGVLSGFGLSLVFIPAVLVVAFYFNRKRSLATGIAVAGSGIGTFIFAPVTELLIQEYSWRGTLIIVGGIMLNLVVCGSIFRPLQEANNELEMTISDRGMRKVSNRISLLSSSESPVEEDDALNNNPFSYSNDNYHLSTLSQMSGLLSQSLILLPTYFDGSDYVLQADLVLLMKKRKNRLLSEGHEQSGNGESPLVEANKLTDQEHSCDYGVPALDNSTSDREDCSTLVTVANAQAEGMLISCLAANSAILSGSSFGQTDQMVQLCRDLVFCRRGLLQARFLLARGHLSSCPDIYLNAAEEKCFSHRLQKLLFSRRRVIHMLRKTFDLSIFKNATFDYFCLHSMLLYMSYNNPYIYLPDTASEHGIPNDSASTLVAIVGLTSTMGQIVMGFIGDRPRVDTFLFYSAMTSIAGFVTLFVPLFTTFPFLALYSTLYGFFISANYALTSIILVNILGIEQLTNSFGVVSSAGGVAVLIGPPFAGWISDQTGSYKSTFYISGVIILFSGCMLFLVPCLRGRRTCCRKPVAEISSCKIVKPKPGKNNDCS